ncbi:hypothetical protein LSH36_1080g00015 [Paralvinella palmiformis]|uniref:NADAR domain-containing protein n=1 Tax=Paralvinella palmiformis TaxID=53620 RepID=A0AAD9IVX1_9ANNE|nr:hypothetical protein LSH36_1080g00015 [Paralvinella palmiformis]
MLTSALFWIRITKLILPIRTNGDKLKVDVNSCGVDDIPNLPSHLNPEKACTKRTNDVMVFFGKHSPLSNFLECSLTLDGAQYTGVEQRYQQKKAEWAKNDKLAQQIISATYPAKQKYLGDKVKVDDETWKTIGLIEMFNAVKAKFVQNDKLKKYLLATGSLSLGEASTDSFWGIGSTLQNPQSLDAAIWTGNNHLGKILMRVRYELK